jgi:hypothetical protein
MCPLKGGPEPKFRYAGVKRGIQDGTLDLDAYPKPPVEN